MIRPPKPRGGWTILLGILAVSLAVVGAPLRAQEGRDPFELQLEGTARLYDNFFRQAEPPDDLAVAWTTSARLTLGLDRDGRTELFGEAEHTYFETLGESHGFAAGLRAAGDSHQLRLRATYLKQWPTWDVGDFVETADIIRVNGDHESRIGPDWSVGVSGYWSSVRFPDPARADSRLFGVGAHVRYRGLSYRVQPEVGVEAAWRVADDPNRQDRRGRLVAGFVLMPVDAVWMRFRYRYRTRVYPGAEPASTNFERTDIGRQWTVTSSFRVTSNLSFNVRYDILDQGSPLDGRSFQAQTVNVGTTLRL